MIALQWKIQLLQNWSLIIYLQITVLNWEKIICSYLRAQHIKQNENILMTKILFCRIVWFRFWRKRKCKHSIYVFYNNYSLQKWQKAIEYSTINNINILLSYIIWVSAFFFFFFFTQNLFSFMYVTYSCGRYVVCSA